MIKILSTILALTNAASAQVASHNGSLVTVAAIGDGGQEIRYLRPRLGLAEVGVIPGTLLFRGQWSGPPPQVIDGTAFVFAPGCPPIPYAVTGGVDGNVLVLRGPAPLVTPWCAVVGLAWTGNSELLFVPEVR